MVEVSTTGDAGKAMSTSVSACIGVDGTKVGVGAWKSLIRRGFLSFSADTRSLRAGSFLGFFGSRSSLKSVWTTSHSCLPMSVKGATHRKDSSYGELAVRSLTC